MQNDNKIGLFSLVGIIVGAIVGAGIFNLMKEMANNASPGAAVIGWILTGIGMGTLAFSMVSLNRTHPHLEAGVFSYARAGFGKYIGFYSVWGYWVSNMIGNVAYATLMFNALSYFIPSLGNGQNIISIIGASIVLWMINMLILRGINEAAVLNAIVMLAKLVPLVLFIVVVGFAFNSEIFFSNIWGTHDGSFSWSEVYPQIRKSMLVTVWVFIGVEGAVIFSSRARRKSDVGKATIISFISVAAIYIAITLLSYGIFTQAQLSKMENPAMAYILEAIIGKPGAWIVNAGVVIAIFGAWLANTMLGEEIVYQASVQKLFPPIFGNENKRGVPLNATIITNSIIQLIMVSILFTTEGYSVLSQLSAAVILFSYTCVALFQLKVQIKYALEGKVTFGPLLIGIVSSLYMIWLCYASGFNYFVLTMLSLCPGTLVYIYAQKKYKEQIFTKYEIVIAIISVALFIYGAYSFPTLVNL